MLVVSARLFALSRAISSAMLTSASLETNFSSSIFASSSAIGASKSKKFIAIRRVYAPMRNGEHNGRAPSGQLARAARR
jgi:hypothetical protein